MLVSRGVRVVDSRGFRFCEVWWRESGFDSGTIEEALRQDAVPVGALLGVIEYQVPSADRNGRGFGRGIYLLRYAGEDSAALIPATADRGLEAGEGFAGLARGTLRWTWSPEGAAPRFEMNARGEWTLYLRAGGVTVALLVAGVQTR